jgi:hypothetical protein
VRGCPFVYFELIPAQFFLSDHKQSITVIQYPFLFTTSKNNSQGGDKLARSNYSFKKRQKELARKKKKEQKRQRKLDKDTNIPEETSDQSQDEKIH